MSKVDLNHVWKIYPRGNVVGVKDLTFTIQDTEFLAILGPSGGGKLSDAASGTSAKTSGGVPG